MNRVLLLALTFGTLLSVEGKLYPLAVRLPLQGEPAAPGESVWPAPNQLTVSSGVYTLNKDKFKVEYEPSLNKCEKEILEKLWQHYESVLFPPKPIEFAKPSSSSVQMNKLSFRLKARGYGPANAKADCRTDYYPVIEDLDTEACKYWSTSPVASNFQVSEAAIFFRRNKCPARTDGDKCRFCLGTCQRLGDFFSAGL